MDPSAVIPKPKTAVDRAIDITDSVLGFIVLFSFLLYWYRVPYLVLAYIKTKRVPDTDKKGTYAILVPARNESAIISGIISSLKAQTYDKSLFDVYIIVESEEDKTVEITKEAGYNIVIRKNLEGRKTKGFALDDALQEILTCERTASLYDAYFVFDADNILSPNYIEEMNKCYQAGYQVAMGFRNSNNATKNWISGCSAMTFTLLNAFNSKPRSKFFEKLIISGTGFYVDAKIVNELGHWIWNGLSEDTELTYYCVLHNLRCKYVDYVEYYDEQPTTMKVVKSQHIRWIKGRTNASNLYMKKINSLFCSSCSKKGKQQTEQKICNRLCIMDYALSFCPIVLMVVAVIVYTLINIGYIITNLITDSRNLHAVISLGITLNSTYFAMVVWSASMVIADGPRMKFSFWFALKIVLTNPIFLCSYGLHALSSIMQKNVSWDPIKHIGQSDQKAPTSNLADEILDVDCFEAKPENIVSICPELKTKIEIASTLV